jgi:predicted small secreted protein
MLCKQSRALSVVLAAASLTLTACGDSTGPGDVSSTEALQSLAVGLAGAAVGSPATTESLATFSALAPFLDRVTVNIGGNNQEMFALGLRETFPPGTCMEDIFINPDFPPEPGVCTPPQLMVSTIMWQSHSANAPPDKLLILSADVGTADFGAITDGTVLPAVAIYIAGEEQVLISQSGTVTTQVQSLNQECGTSMPPYAKSGTCSFASFSQSGNVVMEEFLSEAATPPTLSIGIPSVTFDGLWLNVTEVQPVTLPAATRLSPQLLRRSIMKRALIAH